MKSLSGGSFPGEAVVCVADVGLNDPEQGTLASSGFLVSFQLKAVAPGTSAVTPVPFDDGSVLSDGSWRPVGAVQFNAATVIVRQLNGVPTIALTSPSEGAVFSTSAKVTITATASSTNSTVARVDFYADGTNNLGAVLSVPYTFEWTNAPPGAHTLTATATDAFGATASSAAVHIMVNIPPGVAITSPANGAIFPAPASIPINVTASDSDGSVTQVLFYAGNTLLGIDTTSPYAFTWSNVSTGTYSLTARAVDDRGATTISSPVSIQVRPSNGVPVIVATGALLDSESGPVNRALDAGETVTIRFFIRNTGGSDVPNLTATLQPSGGVVSPSPSGAQSYGALLAGAPAVGMPFTFQASGSPGANITATLQLNNGTNSLGSLTYTFALGNTTTFVTPSQITIPAGGPNATGAASIYPSQFATVSLPGLIDKVSVVFSNLWHDFPSDIDALLVGAGGQKVMLLSDAGLSYKITNIVVTFDDAAAGNVPNNGPITSSTYRPTDYEPGETMPSPAPAGPYGITLSTFRGQGPNATWSLYVADDTAGEGGKIVNGWLLTITTFDPVNPVADLGLTVTGAPNPAGLGSNVTWTVTVTNTGSEYALGVVVTNPLPSGVTLVSSTSSQGSCSNAGTSVICDLGGMAANASATMTLVATIAAVGTKTFTPSVGGPTVDFNTANNSATATTLVNGAADLALTMTDVPDPIGINSLLAYVLTVTNRGPNTATSVTVTNTLPAGVSFISAFPSQGSYSVTGSLVTCNLGDIANAAKATIQLNMNSPAVPGLLTNRAGVWASMPDDQVPANNSATEITTNLNPSYIIVAASAVLAAESGPINGAIDIGETVSVGFYLKNLGNVNTANLTATLLSGSGVASPSGAMNYGAVLAGGPAVSSTNSFTATGTNGGLVTAALQLQDGALNLGTVNFTFPLPNAFTLANLSTLTIPDYGTAAPYPSTISISNVSGNGSVPHIRIFFVQSAARCW